MCETSLHRHLDDALVSLTPEELMTSRHAVQMWRDHPYDDVCCEIEGRDGPIHYKNPDATAAWGLARWELDDARRFLLEGTWPTTGGPSDG